VSAPIISHLGIAVKDLDAAIRIWSLVLGMKPSLVTDVADQKVKVAIFPGDAASGGDSSINRFLAKRGDGLHHVCIYVDDIEARLRELKSEGVRLIDDLPRRGAEGRRIAFVHPSGTNGVLLELEERPRKS
jgi:methylmalonyl-CoA/ethylmalonyl-CoA epimerase